MPRARCGGGSIDGEFDRKVLDYACREARGDHAEHRLALRSICGGAFAARAETLAYQHAAQPRRRLLRLDVGDARPVAIGDEAFIARLAVSADGRQAIVTRFDPTTNTPDPWRIDLGGGTSARLTFTARGQMEETALFSPGGERVALTGLGENGAHVPWIQPTGGGTKDLLRPDSEKGLHRPDRLIAR